MRMVILLLLCFVASQADARQEQVRFNWQHDCHTVNGDSLDPNGDGTCELLNVGWRFYTEAGEFIGGMAEDGTRDTVIQYNMPFGLNQCHYMTAVMEDPANPTEVLESDPSNVGACRDIVPGKPTRVSLLNQDGDPTGGS